MPGEGKQIPLALTVAWTESPPPILTIDTEHCETASRESPLASLA
jgi:hypothetical protein